MKLTEHPFLELLGGISFDRADARRRLGLGARRRARRLAAGDGRRPAEAPRRHRRTDVERLQAAAQRCADVSDRLAALVDADSAAYDRVVAAYRLPKETDRREAARAARHPAGAARRDRRAARSDAPLRRRDRTGDGRRARSAIRTPRATSGWPSNCSARDGAWREAERRDQPGERQGRGYAGARDADVLHAGRGDVTRRRGGRTRADRRSDTAHHSGRRRSADARASPRPRS